MRSGKCAAFPRGAHHVRAAHVSEHRSVMDGLGLESVFARWVRQKSSPGALSYVFTFKFFQGSRSGVAPPVRQVALMHMPLVMTATTTATRRCHSERTDACRRRMGTLTYFWHGNVHVRHVIPTFPAGGLQQSWRAGGEKQSRKKRSDD